MTGRGRVAITCMAMLTAVTVTGCEWGGLNSLPLPGTAGTGDNAYEIRVELPDATMLTQNSPVRVDDVTVGSVRRIEAERCRTDCLSAWHSVVTLGIDGGVTVPVNATAKVGQTSLLGSNHVELAPPPDEPPQGMLEDGDVIPLERAGAFPTTEQALSALSVVLNGGGLAQLQDITRELDTALTGHTDAARDLLPRLAELTGTLNGQRSDIVSALEGLDRLSGAFAQDQQVLVDALDDVPSALDVLAGQRANITAAVSSAGRLSAVANEVIATSGDNLEADLRHLTPVLDTLANTGNHLVDVLSILLTFPFSTKHMDRWLIGDYANLDINLDLTNSRLDSNFLTGTPLGGTLGGVEGLLGQMAGTAGHAVDPLRGPVAAPVSRGGGAP
ncbi:MCE family protein [Rhodococcus gannanensis]|uniref:MCE family protein n=1 Tax=Rhodococcus gannanensis TaxID=1960308 RepID=A0ABW4P5K5_9NOCA